MAKPSAEALIVRVFVPHSVEVYVSMKLCIGGHVDVFARYRADGAAHDIIWSVDMQRCFIVGVDARECLVAGGLLQGKGHVVAFAIVLGPVGKRTVVEVLCPYRFLPCRGVLHTEVCLHSLGIGTTDGAGHARRKWRRTVFQA